MVDRLLDDCFLLYVEADKKRVRLTSYRKLSSTLLVA